MNKKTILIISLIASLASQNLSYASSHNNSRKDFQIEHQDQDLEEYLNQIILDYDLENMRDCILKNKSKFLLFYETVMSNENILSFAQKTMLESFEMIIHYLDDAGFERDLERVKNMHIEILTETCNSKNIAGYYLKGEYGKPDLVALVSESIDVLLHERNHQIFTDCYQEMIFQNRKYVYRKDLKDKVTLTKGNYSSYDISFLNEAIAEDLKSETKKEYQDSYNELVNILQCFYFLWGREEFLSHLKDGEMFPDYFYNVLHESGLSESEIVNLVYELGEIRKKSSKFSNSMTEHDMIAFYHNTAEKIIKMYEFKTKQKWTESIEMEFLIGNILYSNNAHFNIENAVNGTFEIPNMNPEIREFIEKQTFANKYFDSLEINNSSVKYDSAMAPDTLMSENFCESSRTFTYQYRNGKKIKSDNYTTNEMSSEQKLKYGITTERDYQLIKNNANFYRYLWSVITSSSFLTEQEKEIYKKNILNYYEKFRYEFELFPNDFTYYFPKVYKNISSKTDFDKLMENKDYLYQFDNPTEYEFLKKNGISSNMITYFIHLPNWQLYRDSISQLSFLKEEEKKILYQSYPIYFENRLNLSYVGNDISLISEELSSCNSLEELWSLINTKRMPVYNETKEKEFNRLVLELNS